MLDELYRRNVSLQTLDGVLCHNGEFCCQKLARSTTSTFEQLDRLVEICNEDESRIKTLRPSTLEGCVVRVSDMIAYIGKDRQDAYDMGVIDSYDAFDGDALGTTNAQIINNLTVDIVNNSYGTDSIAMSREIFEDLKRAKRQNYELIYDREGMTADARNIVEEMFSGHVRTTARGSANRTRGFARVFAPRRLPRRKIKNDKPRSVSGNRSGSNRRRLPGVDDR